MLEKKSFTGGMNKDVEDRLIPSTDWKDAWNIRAVATNDGNLGAIENCMGNKLITGVGSDPNDDILVIGTYEDKGSRRVYYFVYVEDQYGDFQHSILQYNIETNTTENIAFNCSVLNFQKDHLITGIVVIDDKYLLWTDDYNEPGFIDLEKARAATYGTQTTLQEIRLIPYAPVDPITYTYENDASYSKNNLRGKLWEFKYRFVYKDGRKSAFSVISRIIYPIEFMTISSVNYNINQLDQTKNNKIVLSVPVPKVGDISKIEIAARDSNLSDFKIVKTLKTENYSTDFDLSLGFTGVKNVSFYNDEPTKSIAINESNAIFSYVPLKAKALDIVNNNRIVLANIEEGYDNIDLGLSSAGVLRTNVIPGSSSPSGSFVNLGIYRADEGFPDSTLGFRYFLIQIGSNIYPNRTYSITVTPASGSSKTYSYTTSNSTVITDIRNFFIASINNDFRDSRQNYTPFISQGKSKTADYFFTYWNYIVGLPYSDATDGYNGIKISDGSTINLINEPPGSIFVINNIGNENDNRIASVSLSIVDVSGSQDFTSIQSFKNNAYHKFGIVYYDAAGRASTVQTNDRFKMYCPHKTNSLPGQVNGLVYLSHQAPSWAKKYQIVYSGSMGYLSDPAEGRGFIQFLVKSIATQYDDVTLATDLKRWRVSAESTLWYSHKFNQNPITYTWKSGDRLRTVKLSGGNYVDPKFFDFNILGYDSAELEFIIETDGTGKPGEGDILEVYTPSNNQSADLFYETGYVFDINENGEHQGNVVNQSLSGSVFAAEIKFQAGDVFLRNRTMDKVDPQTGTSQVTILVEDSHYSDFYRSNSYNKGRPNIFNLDERNIRREASARYSELYIPDTNINGVGTFFDTSFSDYDKVYGNIQKIRNKGKYLVVFQQVKTGRVRVNESILSDMSNFEAVQKSNQVLSDIDYYAEDTGIGNNPESFAESGNSIYFIDAYKGSVNRLSGDGITKISNYGVRTFFNKELPKFISKNVWGVYDERFDSYIVSFPAVGDYTGYSISFHEPSNRWTSFYNFASEASVTCGVNFITFKRGVGYLHNQTGVPYCNFYGVQYPSSVQIAFNENPSNIKVFKNLEVESNDIWTANISNQRGQASNLIDADYEKIENVYWASLWKDTNSPGGLVDGDDLRSPELIIKLSNDSTNFVKLFTVGLKYFNSESTNR